MVNRTKKNKFFQFKTETNMEPVINLADVQTVSVGISHSMALTRDGKVFAWGCNLYGQLRISSPQKKWGVRACHEQTFCSITHDDVEQWRAAYLISPSGMKFPYTTTAILEWLRKKNTNPASNEVIENAREVINLLEAAVKFQGRTRRSRGTKKGVQYQEDAS